MRSYFVALGRKLLYYLILLFIGSLVLYVTAQDYLTRKDFRYMVSRELALAFQFPAQGLSFGFKSTDSDGFLGVVYKDVKFEAKDHRLVQSDAMKYGKSKIPQDPESLGRRNILTLDFMKVKVGLDILNKFADIKLKAKINERSSVLVRRKLFFNEARRSAKRLRISTWKIPSQTSVKFTNIPLSHILLAIYHHELHYHPFAVKWIDGEVSGTLSSHITFNPPNFPLKGKYRFVVKNLHITKFGLEALGDSAFRHLKIDDLDFDLEMQDGYLKPVEPIELKTSLGSLFFDGSISFKTHKDSSRIKLFRQRFPKEKVVINRYPYYQLKIKGENSNSLYKALTKKLGCFSLKNEEVILSGHWDQLLCYSQRSPVSLESPKKEVLRHN